MPTNIMENRIINAWLFIFIIKFVENKKIREIATANIIAIFVNEYPLSIDDLITDVPPKIYADSSAKDNILIQASPMFADIGSPKNNPTSFRLKSA
jgi:hypothetical protein